MPPAISNADFLFCTYFSKLHLFDWGNHNKY